MMRDINKYIINIDVIDTVNVHNQIRVVRVLPRKPFIDIIILKISYDLFETAHFKMIIIYLKIIISIKGYVGPWIIILLLNCIIGHFTLISKLTA
jgi:hypothetical protein